MKRNRSILTATLLLILAACSEEMKVTPFTYPQVFAGEEKKGWSVRSVQLISEGKGTQTFRFDNCVLDDIYIFYNDAERNYVITEGSSKCNDADPATIVTSSWAFSNPTATLTIIMPLLSVNPLPFILKEVDGSKMVIDIYLDDRSAYRFNFRPTSLE
ncbi:MAG TPA: hypothetical protein VK508_03275 [Cyclobacteriaceae bacterium]|nr:hypothetical protein [Cyclobacteriaceae bacterium]